MTFDGRRPLTEDAQAYNCLIHLRDNCTVTVSVLEDDLLRKKTFDGRQPLTEDDL